MTHTHHTFHFYTTRGVAPWWSGERMQLQHMKHRLLYNQRILHCSPPHCDGERRRTRGHKQRCVWNDFNESVLQNVLSGNENPVNTTQLKVFLL